uniref:Uncharacterized protein n=1 Tax=Setaria italica TaxID=4555 RepID=A0A0Q3VUF6_SETIT
MEEDLQVLDAIFVPTFRCKCSSCDTTSLTAVAGHEAFVKSPSELCPVQCSAGGKRQPILLHQPRRVIRSRGGIRLICSPPPMGIPSRRIHLLV